VKSNSDQRRLREIKAVICDLDGTLLNHEVTVSRKTLEAVMQLKKEGYLFGYATGRAIFAVEDLMGEWGMDKQMVDFIIGLNGGHMKDYRLHKEARNNMISGSVIQEIMEYFKEYSVNYAVYLDDFLAVYRDDEITKKLCAQEKTIYKVVDFQEIFQQDQSKLMMLCNPDDMESIKEHASKHCFPGLQSMQAGKVEYEYMNADLSKSVAIDQICQWHGMTLENILAFGDSDNDMEMVRDAGFGVAMGNASALTKSVADAITLTNREDGVAAFLLENIL
jgi:Cof subfamily protein (haloacid dehalogenase superfamily)